MFKVSFLKPTPAHWCIGSPRHLDDAVNNVLENGISRKKASFFRDALRKELEKLGFNLKLFTLQSVQPDFLNSGLKEEKGCIKFDSLETSDN